MEQTLIIVKPDAVSQGRIGECLARFEKAKIKIVSLRILKLQKKFVREFYAHLERKLNAKLFNSIIDFMTSGNVVVAVLQGDSVIRRVKKICGDTNPALAKKGTIRADFSKDDLRISERNNRAVKNVIHAAGKDDAKREITMFRSL